MSNPFPLTYSNHVDYPSPSYHRPCISICRTPTHTFPTAPSHSLASSTPTSSLTWISWFCSLPGHDYFCEVAEDFIEDDFNLTGLNAMVPFWKEAMEMVLDVEPGAFPPTPDLSSVLSNDVIDEDSAKIPDVSIVEASAELLYGLVHQRYVLTRAGLHAMVSKLPLVLHRGRNYELKCSQAEKYEAGVFGSCPRVYCMGCNVVPCGRSDLPGLETVKLFCPNCNDIYVPASSRFQGVDGMFPSMSAKYFY